LELLREFKRVELSLSIDGIGKHNEYIRNPSSWAVVETSARAWLNLAEKTGGWTVGLCATISALSLVSLPPLLAWWNSASSGAKVILQPVFDPLYMSPEILPREFVEKYSDQLPAHARSFFSSRKHSPENLSRFFQFNFALDRLRGESLFEAFGELASLLSDADRLR
jgi:hypothetical protein